MITVRFYRKGRRQRMRVTGHASKWVCGAVTMFTQACAGYTVDADAFFRNGRTDTEIPGGHAGRFVRWTLEALAREKPTEVRIASGPPRGVAK
jgi:hypothetical protein